MGAEANARARGGDARGGTGAAVTVARAIGKFKRGGRVNESSVGRRDETPSKRVMGRDSSEPNEAYRWGWLADATPAGAVESTSGGGFVVGSERWRRVDEPHAIEGMNTLDVVEIALGSRHALLRTRAGAVYAPARARVGNSVFPADGTPLRPLAWTSTASPSRSRAVPRTRSPSCETRSLARRRRTAAATRAWGDANAARDYSVDRTRGASRGFRRAFPSTTSSLWARVRLVRHRSRGSRWFKSRAGRVTRRASPKPARVTPGVKGRFTPSGTVIARVNARLAF